MWSGNFRFFVCWFPKIMQNVKHCRKKNRERDLQKRMTLNRFIILFFKTEGISLKENEHRCGLVFSVFQYFDLQIPCRILNIAEKRNSQKWNSYTHYPCKCSAGRVVSPIGRQKASVAAASQLTWRLSNKSLNLGSTGHACLRKTGTFYILHSKG